MSIRILSPLLDMVPELALLELYSSSIRSIDTNNTPDELVLEFHTLPEQQVFINENQWLNRCDYLCVFNKEPKIVFQLERSMS